MQEELRFEEQDGDLIVRFLCEIDHHTARSMRGRIDRTVFDRRPSRLVLDLTDVRFMDSSGLGLILGRLAFCREVRVGLCVRGASGTVMKMIRLAGIDRSADIAFESAYSLKP